MKLSILIPTKDRLTLLKEAISSAREQTHRNIEIVISDDGSSDETRAWLAELTALDSRVRLTPPNPCPGLFENINHLLDHRRGDAFCILADDDRLHPEFAERLLEPMHRWPNAVASFADFWQIDANGRVLPDESRNEAMHTGRADLRSGIVAEPVPAALRNRMVLGLTLYRTSSIDRERFDVACGGAADIDFGVRIASFGSLVYVPLRLGEVRVHPARASALRARYMVSGLIRALSKHHFEERSCEALRLEMLQSARVSYAVLLRNTDRLECLSTILEYFKDARSLSSNRHVLSLAASAAFACLPRTSAAYLLRVVSAMRTSL